MEPWIQTYTGKRFDLIAPTVDQVVLADIVHALDRVQRFSGHTKAEWSVLKHSLFVAAIVTKGSPTPETILQALLHDAAEAYIGDISSPLKYLLSPSIQQIEERIWNTIALAFKISPVLHPDVIRADAIALVTEAKYLLIGGPIYNWIDKFDVKPLSYSALRAVAVNDTTFMSHADLFLHELSIYTEALEWQKSSKQTPSILTSILKRSEMPFIMA